MSQSDQNTQKSEIIINLQESSNAKEFKLGNRIHPMEFEHAILLIDRGIERATEYRDQEKRCKEQDNKNNSRQRINDTISILGSRGSGKTSFLLSLLKYYKDKEEYKDKAEAEVLEIIDPTLIEEKGHVFLTILSLIEEAVCKKMKLDDCSPNDANYCLKKEWKDMLRKLADGLPSIDGIGLSMNDTNWQDAEFIMDRGLKSVKAAKDLEANFNGLVTCALKTLDKKVFIITLDDIDVDFRKGWPVLETIRKYLTSPQIIVLLSGDLKLYSKAIRKQQWKNFGKALLKNEADALNKSNAYNELVTEMEGQYLQKVIKPENRIHLTTLLEKIELYSQIIEIKTKDSSIKILDYYNNELIEFGIINRFQAETYTSFLLSLPIRTQIQFLLNFNNEDATITDAFLSDLFEKEVDVDLAKNMPKMLNVVILKLLMKEQILAESYQLQPTSTDASLNASLMALSLLFSQQVKNNPYLIFDYFIKIGYMNNLVSNLGYKDKTDNKSEILPSIEGLCKSSGIYQDKVLRDITGNITAYIKGFINIEKHSSNGLFAGIIPLYGLASRSTKKPIDKAFMNESLLKRRLAYLPLSISSDFSNNNTFLSCNIYMLIATIGELIRKNQNNENISKGILELSQIRTYLMPKFKGDLNQNYNDSDDDNEESDFNELNNENEIQLESLIQNWFKKYPSNTIKISPHFLGKISTRFYFTISSIEKQYKSNFLGDNMYRRIIALFNAIIVEELKENESTNKRRESKKKLWNLNLDNPVTSDQIFINNLRVAMENKRELKLSTWLLSCHLFLVYLPCDENDFRESKRSMMLSTGRMTNINKDEDKENRLKENYRYLKDLLLNFISVGHEDDEKLTDSLFKNSIFLNLQQVELKTDKRLNNKDQI